MDESRTAAQPGGDSPLDICIRLNSSYTQSMRRIDARLSALHGLSFSDFTVLHHLHQAQGSRLRRTDLAECMGLTVSGVTRALLPLEKMGLVARQADARDARVGYACLTPAGQALLGHATETARQSVEEVMQSLRQDWLRLAGAASRP